MKPRPAALAAVVLAILAPASYAPAQANRSQPQQPAQSPAQTPAQSPGPTLLMDQPFEVPSLGLSVYLPEDSLVDISRIEGGRTTVKVMPNIPSQPWVIEIHNSISADRTLDINQAMENVLSQRQAQKLRKIGNRPEFSLVRVFDRVDDLFIGQHPARRAYLDVPEEPEFPVTGYTFFETGPGQFIIFTLHCGTRHFPKVREMYELLVATVQFRDPEEMASDRAAALLAGDALISQFNADDFDRAIADEKPVFFRIYRPAPTGAAADAEEVAYQRVQARKGSAGELDPRKSRSSWTSADRENGWLVRIDARALTREATIDTVSHFFLSRTRANELWSITMTIRRKSGTEQWTETGFRQGTRLTVKTTLTGGEPTESAWSPLPESYISRVETLLMPALATNAGAQGLYGFYSYESSLAKISLRRDTIERRADNTWLISTQPSENSATTRSVYRAGGELVRREMPDGAVMEPIDPARLKRLWTDKKLPMD